MYWRVKWQREKPREKEKLQSRDHGRRLGGDVDGDRRPWNSGPWTKWVPKGTRVLWAVAAWHWRRWLISGGDLGGGEFHGCDDDGEIEAPEENQRKHQDGDGTRITEGILGWTEDDRNDTEKKMTEEEEDERRRYFSGRERSGRVGIE